LNKLNKFNQMVDLLHGMR